MWSVSFVVQLPSERPTHPTYPHKHTQTQLLDRAASAQVRVDQARQAAELTARHHLDLAPATFEVVKGLFGNKGPCAMPRETLLRDLRARTTSKTGLSPADAEEQLRLVLRLLPAWIRLDHPAGVSLADMRVVVRIHRRTPWPELRQQLLERVAAARAAAVPVAGRDAEAAAAAEAADRAQELLDAAVARAKATAAAQAISGGSGGGAACSSDGGGGDCEASVDQAASDDEEEEGNAAEEEGSAEQPRAPGPSPSKGAAAVAAAGAQVEPETLAACLKARIWGQQKARGSS
jgi:hypothetical protein